MLNARGPETEEMWIIKFILACLCTCTMAAVASQGQSGYQEPCKDDSSCIDENQYCQRLAKPCLYGICVCREDRAWNGDKCKVKKTNGQKCVDADDICVTGICSNGLCSCDDGYTYNSNLKDCLADDLKLLGEGCVSADECNDLCGTVQCEITCKCKTGYIQENYECRPPHVGEKCIDTNASPPGVDCATMISDKDEPSLAFETCKDDTCTCPSESTLVKRKFMGKDYTYCLAKYSGTLKEDGAICDSHNSCKSYNCLSCPGNTTRTCLREIQVSRSSGASRGIWTVVIAFVFLKYMV